MQVSVEATGALERGMTVQVPQERVEKEVEGRLQKLARTAKLKGFRPGKVPINVVKSHYGTQVRQEVVGFLIRRPSRIQNGWKMFSTFSKTMYN